MRYFPTLSTKERDGKQSSLNGPNVDDQKKTCFHDLQAKEDKGANSCEGTSNSYFLLL